MKRFHLLLPIMFLLLMGCQTKMDTPAKIINYYYQDGKFNVCLLIAQNNLVVIDKLLAMKI